MGNNCLGRETGSFDVGFLLWDDTLTPTRPDASDGPSLPPPLPKGLQKTTRSFTERRSILRTSFYLTHPPTGRSREVCVGTSEVCLRRHRVRRRLRPVWVQTETPNPPDCRDEGGPISSSHQFSSPKGPQCVLNSTPG